MESASDAACVAVPEAFVEVDAHGGLVVVVERAEDVLLVPGRVVADAILVEEAAGVRGVGGVLRGLIPHRLHSRVCCAVS